MDGTAEGEQYGGAVEMIVRVVVFGAVAVDHEQDLVDSIAVGELAPDIVGSVVFGQYPPVLIIVIQGRLAGNRIYLADAPAQGIIRKFGPVVVAFLDLDDAVLVVILILIIRMVRCQVAGFIVRKTIAADASSKCESS